jgi:hypothetical protein
VRRDEACGEQQLGSCTLLLSKTNKIACSSVSFLSEKKRHPQDSIANSRRNKKHADKVLLEDDGCMLRFSEPGTYLLICNVRQYFLNGMFAFVEAKRDKSKGR